jgi:hypothetical protein
MTSTRAGNGQVLSKLEMERTISIRRSLLSLKVNNLIFHFESTYSNFVYSIP